MCFHKIMRFLCLFKVLKVLKIMCGKYIRSIYIFMKHAKNITWKHILENVQLGKPHEIYAIPQVVHSIKCVSTN